MTTGVAASRLAVAILLHLLLAASCRARRDFLVGGRGGWTTSPAEPFNRWAERNRFQVNDSLVFRYSGHSDSVLVVSQSHYDACNTTDPFLRLDGGDSVFVLSNSGPYFFISGDAGRCRAGERLIVVVLAVRPTKSRGSSAAPPPPSSTPAPPPKASSSSPIPPPASSSTSPPPPPTAAAGNSSSTSPPPSLAPPTVANATVAPPPHSPSSASALRGGVLAFLVTAAGAIALA